MEITLKLSAKEVFAISKSLGRLALRKRFGTSPLSEKVRDQLVAQIPPSLLEDIEKEWKKLIQDYMIDGGKKDRPKNTPKKVEKRVEKLQKGGGTRVWKSE